MYQQQMHTCFRFVHLIFHDLLFHYFYTLDLPKVTQVVRPSVSKLQNQAKNHCGLGEWIIDDYCLILFYCE